MDKHFVLLIQYTTGECAFPTDTDDLMQALTEFKSEYLKGFSKEVLESKTFSLPKVVSARIVRIYSRI